MFNPMSAVTSKWEERRGRAGKGGGESYPLLPPPNPFHHICFFTPTFLCLCIFDFVNEHFACSLECARYRVFHTLLPLTSEYKTENLTLTHTCFTAFIMMTHKKTTRHIRSAVNVVMFPVRSIQCFLVVSHCITNIQHPQVLPHTFPFCPEKEKTKYYTNNYTHVFCTQWVCHSTNE